MNGAARQVPDKPAVDGTEEHFALLGARTRARHRIEEPLNLCRRKIRVEPQARLAVHKRLNSLFAKRLAPVVRSAVLPNERRRNRLARLAVPKHGRLALIRHADRSHLFGRHARFSETSARHGKLRAPNLGRIVLNPAGLGKMLRKLHLLERDDLRAAIEKNRARTRRALIERKNVLHE